MTDMGFNLVGGLRNKGGSGERAMAMVVKLVWRLWFGFEAKLVWGCMGEVHLNLYRAVGRVQNN
jgi:hypothetical protein